MEHIGGGTYRQTFDPDGPQADCWVYEDLVYINKRHVAAVGFDRDDMTMSPITYDEMRPGCYEPKARIADMEANWVEASLCFPTFPRFCGQTFLEAKDQELAEACVVAYNDFMVEEWCGDSGGRLLPLCIIPLWDAEKAAAEVRRNAARGVRAVCFSEIPPHLGLPEHPQRVLGSRSSRPARRPAPSSACTSGRRPRCRPPRPTLRWRWRPRSASATPCRRCATSSSPASSSASRRSMLAYSEGQIGWLPYILERADDVWREHRAWGGVKDIVPRTPVDLLPPPGLRLLLPRPARVRLPGRHRRPIASPSRPTTRTPTRPGPTPARWPSRWCGTCPTTTCTGSCGATPSRCSA